MNFLANSFLMRNWSQSFSIRKVLELTKLQLRIFFTFGTDFGGKRGKWGGEQMPRIMTVPLIRCLDMWDSIKAVLCPIDLFLPEPPTRSILDRMLKSLSLGNTEFLNFSVSLF